MTELVLQPLADAFMQVSVFVAALVVPFGWARWRWGARLDELILRKQKLGPLVGALLGVTPGCGGAVLIMPLYVRGTVSFGTVVGALVATMGDSSFVILAGDPALALKLHGMLFLAGVVTGYIVDALGLSPRSRLNPSTAVPVTTGRSAAEPEPVSSADTADEWVLSAGPPAAPVAGSRLTVLVREFGPVQLLFWLFLVAGMVVGVPVVFQAVDPAALTVVLGGFDPYLAVGVAGTVTALLIFLARGCRPADADAPMFNGLPHVLREATAETAFVTVWVAVAYLAWELLNAATGFDGSALPLFGVVGVLVGALVGLIPGCGIQIMFCGLFLAGGMPLSSLVANAVSQDGDALLPLLALEHRAAVVATLVTSVPAVLAGLLVLGIA